MKNRRYYTYTTTNCRHTVLYIGMTNNISRRMAEHKGKIFPKSSSYRYKVDQLVHFEEYSTFGKFKKRERQLKVGPRGRKEKLINESNSN